MHTNLLIAATLFAASACASAEPATLPLWPQGTPEPWHVAGPERDTTRPSDPLIAGKPLLRITDIALPTLTVYQPQTPTGAAVLVFPGGGYRILAYDLEGTEVCAWLNSISVTCVLVKYRVPIEKHYPDSLIALEDAQQAMRLTRAHAAEWHIDGKRIGVLGFSAGAHLAAVLSNHADDAPARSPATGSPGSGSPANKSPENKSPVNGSEARPDFAVLVYPGYLVNLDSPGEGDMTRLAPGQEPNAHTPPTFLVQAEDDPVHEENALVYYQALKQARVPAELHLFAQGGHGYGLRPTNLPVTRWPALVETWLHTIHVLAVPMPSPGSPGSK